MAYKKYIQKNGKLYGPYLYHSKRVDGKVVSEYYGSGGLKNEKYKKILFVFVGIVVLAALVYFLAFSNRGITGRVVLGLDTSYEKGKPIDGVLKFSLTEGELIPESSKIVFENSGKTYEFVLSDVFDETSSEGDYYINGKEIQGQGFGYGIEGERVIYPGVEFVLQVYSELTESSPEEETPQASSEVPETIPEEVVSEEETPTEVSQEVVQSENTENTPESNTEENSPSPITGNVVKGSRGLFASFFGITGMVSMELENEINGVTSKDKPFTYELKGGERVELKPKSVKAGDKELEDKVVSLKIEEGKAVVTTDYSEIEKGYGKDYAGGKEKTISLDLSDLNLLLDEGNLNIKLVYGNQEILSLTTLLEEGKKTSGGVVVDVEENVGVNESNETPVEENEEPSEPLVEVNKLNKSFAEENQTVEEIVDTSLWEIGDFLTTAERKILMDEFGEIFLESTKSELYNGRIIRGYKFDKYSIEYSYDSSLTKEILEVQMDRDRIKFLKDIANSISKEESIPKNVEDQYNKTYTP